MNWYLWLSAAAALCVAALGHDPGPFIAAMVVIGAMMEMKK